MKITLEELDKVWDEAIARSGHALPSMRERDARLALARYVAQRQRAVEPDHNEIERYEGDGTRRQWGKHTTVWLYPGDRVWVVSFKDGQSVAPLVVEE